MICHPGKSRENYENQDHELMVANPAGYLIPDYAHPDTIGSMAQSKQNLSKAFSAKNRSVSYVDRMRRD